MLTAESLFRFLKMPLENAVVYHMCTIADKVDTGNASKDSYERYERTLSSRVPVTLVHLAAASLTFPFLPVFP